MAEDKDVNVSIGPNGELFINGQKEGEGTSQAEASFEQLSKLFPSVTRRYEVFVNGISSFFTKNLEGERLTMLKNSIDAGLQLAVVILDHEEKKYFPLIGKLCIIDYNKGMEIEHWPLSTFQDTPEDVRRRYEIWSAKIEPKEATTNTVENTVGVITLRDAPPMWSRNLFGERANAYTSRGGGRVLVVLDHDTDEWTVLGRDGQELKVNSIS